MRNAMKRRRTVFLDGLPDWRTGRRERPAAVLLRGPATGAGSGVPQAAWRPVADAAGLSPDPAPSDRVKWVICELVVTEILNIIRIVCALHTQ